MKILVSLAFLLTAVSANATWKTDSELGIVSQSGNTIQDNVIIKTDAKKVSGKNTYNVYGNYLNSAGEVGGVEVRLGESAMAGLKYTRTVSDVLGVYAGVLWEKNRFAGFDQRIGYDLGFRYDILKSDDGGWTLFNETGYRRRSQWAHIVGSEKGEKVDSDFGRVYFEAGKKLSKTSTFRFWVEYLHDFSESENVEINFEPSVNIALGEFMAGDSPAKISLALAYRGMYDKLPPSPLLKNFDSIFSTTIKVLY